MIKIPIIYCKMENHYAMPFQYVCTHPLCLKNKQELACLYCCQQLHKPHLDAIKALKTILSNISEAIEDTEYGAGQMLIKGISTCRNEDDLRQNLSELICYNSGDPKFQKLLDQDCIDLRDNAKNFYQKRLQLDQDKSILQKTVKKRKQNLGQCSETLFISPIFTFLADDAAEQGYLFRSPFSIANKQQKMVTAFAYPPLNRFHDSVEANIKVERVTPFWLGIGVSFQKKSYEDKSKNHIILTSNGWVSSLGKMERSAVKYCSRDTVKVNWDKRRSLIEFTANGQRHTVQLPLKWNRDIYLCIVLYYKDDCVQIMS